MIIFAVDDETMALELMSRTIQAVQPDAELYCFTDPNAMLEQAKTVLCHVAFIDVQMPGMDGLELADRLKKLNPDVNIIFVTGYDQYRAEAMDLFASGYVLKPPSERKIRRQLENLRRPIQNDGPYAQTFGNFALFAHGRPVSFHRAKSKEMLAYLIDRNGAQVSRKELAGVLYADKPYNRTLQSYLCAIAADLESDLVNQGLGEMFVHQRATYSVDKSQFDCDLYDYLSGKGTATYRGEYMEQYPWNVGFKTGKNG